MSEQANATEETLKTGGAKIKFGVSQLNNPSPIWMSKIANGIIFLTLAWGLISMGLTSIPPDLKSSINEWVLVSSGIIKLASKFFGFSLPNNN